MLGELGVPISHEKGKGMKMKGRVYQAFVCERVRSPNFPRKGERFENERKGKKRNGLLTRRAGSTQKRVLT